jgi:hypothetical protein
LENPIKNKILTGRKFFSAAKRTWHIDVVEQLHDIDVEQTASDFISASLSAQGSPTGDFFLTFNGQRIAEDTTLKENGILGTGEELHLASPIISTQR